MKWFGQLLVSVWWLCRQVWQGVYNWSVPPYRTLVVDETIPKELRRRTLYVVQEDGYREQAAMICPCGCRRILHMNLLADECPCWQLTEHEDEPHRSIRRSGGRKIAVRISGLKEAGCNGAAANSSSTAARKYTPVLSGDFNGVLRSDLPPNVGADFGRLLLRRGLARRRGSQRQIVCPQGHLMRFLSVRDPSVTRSRAL